MIKKWKPCLLVFRKGNLNFDTFINMIMCAKSDKTYITYISPVRNESPCGDQVLVIPVSLRGIILLISFKALTPRKILILNQNCWGEKTS